MLNSWEKFAAQIVAAVDQSSLVFFFLAPFYSAGILSGLS